MTDCAVGPIARQAQRINVVTADNAGIDPTVCAPSAQCGDRLTLQQLLHQLETLYNTGCPAQIYAARLGFCSRHALYRALRRHGLPSARRLNGVVHVLAWVHRWRGTGQSLSCQALTAGEEPAARYRTVARFTGRCWSVVRSATDEEIVSWMVREASGN